MNLIKLYKNDNVAVAAEPIPTGTVIDLPFFKGTVACVIPAAHKLSLTDIKTGDHVIKYGFSIGTASTDIPAGTWVHTHNLKTAITDKIDLQYQPVATQPKANQPVDSRTFMGYHRPDNSVGIRNELWILPMVGCVNKTAEILANKFAASLPDGIDGIHAFTHPYGCSQLGDDHENTRNLLASLARHPNAGAVLLLGLGCENNTMDQFLPLLGDYDKNRIRHLVTQQCTDEIAESAKIIQQLLQLVSSDTRQPVDISELCVGLKCGGSDGLSGITANPLCGSFTDMLDGAGGSTLLTEIPEIFGAELSLLPRCKNKTIFDNSLKMLNDFRQYYRDHGLPVSENPSPGNRQGGITTLEEKSLGCVTKAGRATIVDVLDYAQPIRTRGLSLLDGPGNDIVAVTNLAAAGAHMILFTTGRGTPLGGPVPTIKIATNHQLAKNKPHWIDFDAADVLDIKSMQTLTADLMDLVIKIASGEKLARNEKFGYREIAIFKNGVTL